MTYVTKRLGNQLLHYRVEVKNHVCSIVEGQVYLWMSKHSRGFEDHKAAQDYADRQIAEKRKAGYVDESFEQTLENDADVYDKAKWHFGGDFPSDLPIFQGYVHTGLFLGWLIDNDLVSEEFRESNEERIAAFKSKKMTGPKVFEEGCDGVLMLEDISEMGNRFALRYFDFTNGRYLADYEETLGQELPSLYYVQDTWENYTRLKQILDQRLLEWRNAKTIFES